MATPPPLLCLNSTLFSSSSSFSLCDYPLLVIQLQKGLLILKKTREMTEWMDGRRQVFTCVWKANVFLWIAPTLSFWISLDRIIHRLKRRREWIINDRRQKRETRSRSVHSYYLFTLYKRRTAVNEVWCMQLQWIVPSTRTLFYRIPFSFYSHLSLLSRLFKMFNVIGLLYHTNDSCIEECENEEWNIHSDNGTSEESVERKRERHVIILSEYSSEIEEEEEWKQSLHTCSNYGEILRDFSILRYRFRPNKAWKVSKRSWFRMSWASWATNGKSLISMSYGLR